MAYHFTPGPLRVYAKDPYIVVDADGCSVADCAPGNPYMRPETARANARLFAQAPRLLKHLEKAYALMTQLHLSSLPGCPPDLGERIDAMQRAIGDAGGTTE